MVVDILIAVAAFVGGLLVGRKVWAGKFVGQIGDAAERLAKKL